jgi:cytochrome oxidase Cu insertion factor (SCO1/SenC/PrrC family)
MKDGGLMNLKAATMIAFLVLTVSCANKLKSNLSEDLRPRDTPVQVGEAAPDFTLSNQHDQKVTLSSTRSSMPTVIVFYRGNW